MSRRHSQRGLSLIEMVVATLVLVTATGLTYTAFVTSNKWIGQSFTSAPAMGRHVAESFAGAVRADTWAQPGYPLTNGASGSMAAEGNEVDWVVSEPVGAQGYRRVDISVTWPD